MWKNFSVFARRIFTSSGRTADGDFENPLSTGPLAHQLHILILGIALAKLQATFWIPRHWAARDGPAQEVRCGITGGGQWNQNIGLSMRSLVSFGFALRQPAQSSTYLQSTYLHDPAVQLTKGGLLI
jgi:hypothetical protein